MRMSTIDGDGAVVELRCPMCRGTQLDVIGKCYPNGEHEEILMEGGVMVHLECLACRRKFWHRFDVEVFSHADIPEAQKIFLANCVGARGVVTHKWHILEHHNTRRLNGKD